MSETEFYAESVHWLKVIGVSSGLLLGVAVGFSIWHFFGRGPFQG